MPATVEAGWSCNVLGHSAWSGWVGVREELRREARRYRIVLMSRLVLKQSRHVPADRPCLGPNDACTCLAALKDYELKCNRLRHYD